MLEMLENIMLQDYIDYEFDTDKYDREMQALAEREDERWGEIEDE